MYVNQCQIMLDHYEMELQGQGSWFRVEHAASGRDATLRP